MSDVLAAMLTALGAGVVVWVMAGPESQRPAILGRLAAGKSLSSPKVPLLGSLAHKVESWSWGLKLKEYAQRAHPQLIFSDVVAILILSVLAGGFAGAVLLPSGPLILVCAAAGPAAADRILLRVHGRRTARISQQLPEALHIQAAALRAGNSLVQSLRAVADRTAPPLADEAARAVGEIDLGLSQEAALKEFASRIGGREGQLWINAMLIHRITGGNLTIVAESLGRRLRERLDLHREIKALTAQARLSGVVVAAAPIVFLVVLSSSSPQMKVLYETPAGWAMLTAGLLLELVGFFWIKAVLKVKQ